jgi:hypothetical protein
MGAVIGFKVNSIKIKKLTCHLSCWKIVIEAWFKSQLDAQKGSFSKVNVS